MWRGISAVVGRDGFAVGRGWGMGGGAVVDHLG